jgi:hypothetical protein
MRRVVAVLMVAATMVPGAATAQSPMPMPYADFRALAQSFDDAEHSDEPLTIDGLLHRLDAATVRWADEVAQLEAVTPEDCYAAALDEVTGYWRDYAANYVDARPMLAEAKSVMGLIPIALMIESIMVAAHPLAYVDDAASMTGRRLEQMHIIDALQTCEPLSSQAP